MTRPLTLDQARARYPHRYTVEHVPAWAREAMPNGKFPAPQYASDAEWYENTLFPGEGHVGKRASFCESRNQTWPRGKYLDSVFVR